MNRYNHTQRIIEHLVVKNNVTNITKNSKHLLVIFTGTNIDTEQIFKELVNIKNLGSTFDVAISSCGERIHNVDEIKRKLAPRNVYTENSLPANGDFIQTIDEILVPAITQNTAFKVIQGIQDRLVPRLLWEALWLEKPVWIKLDDLLQFKGIQTKQTYILEKVKDAINQLLQMGVKELQLPFSNDLLTTGISSVIENKKQLEKSFNNENKKIVITERDILKLKNTTSEIVVPQGAVITPLARDKAKTLGVKILKK